MTDLRNWKARRSGGRITIHGDDAVTGRVAKITRVDTIEPSDVPASDHVIAVDADENKHKLYHS